jgi:SAM-dependent methyltransferase
MKKSFRDPSGFIFIKGADVYRAIQPNVRNKYQRLLNQSWYKELVRDGKIQSSSWIERSDLDVNYTWLKHEKFDFPLYPHQISAEQLFESALLTLEIAKKAFEHGWILKDASAWNVISLYGNQQFCDITSFEQYDDSGLWIAYGQFCRHYVIPLLLFKYLSLGPAELFMLHRDGVSPEKAKRLLGYRTYLGMAAIETILLPTIIKKGRPLPSRKNKSGNVELNRTIFSNTLKRLENYVTALRPYKFLAKSTWSDYETDRLHYDQPDLNQKYQFVRNALKKVSGPVLDLGCNQGEYSLLAASLGLNVVASDFDESALIKLQAKLKHETINVMLLNLAQPSPSIGWKNSEHESFLNKAKEYFGMVLCLGLIHHLLVSERIPLIEIIDLLASMSRDYVLVEWVNRDDEKFIEIASINAHLYKDLNESIFEKEAKKKFKILDKLALKKTKRTLYLLKKV